MGLMHLDKPAPAPTTPRPLGVTCEKYTRGEGKRCAHYTAGGACTLPGESACLEWLKANAPKARAPATAIITAQAPTPATAIITARTPARPPVARDLFGHPIADAKPAPKTKPSAPVAPPPMPAAKGEPPSTDELRGLTTDDIASFKALGAEVHFKSDTYGDVWLVPAYTGRPRKELTPEHAATIVRVLAAFPGSRVLAFNKSTHTQERPERLEKRSCLFHPSEANTSPSTPSRASRSA